MTGLVISLALLYALQVTFLTNLDISAVLAVQSRPEILRTEDVPTWLLRLQLQTEILRRDKRPVMFDLPAGILRVVKYWYERKPEQLQYQLPDVVKIEDCHENSL